MKVTRLPIPEVCLIEPDVFSDDRGFFFESFSQRQFNEVIGREVFDVTVDIRKSSPTFGQWMGEILSAENKKQLWIPEGFAHGFITLSESAEFYYKATEYYTLEYERCIRWNAPELNIKWPLTGKPRMSDTDNSAPSFVKAEYHS